MTELDQTAAPAESEGWGEVGPAMQRLNERQQKFVRALLVAKPGYGAATKAYRAAGYRAAKPAREAFSLIRNPKVIEAISEEAKKLTRGIGHAEAVAALFNMIRDPKHRDHARAVASILDRVDPVMSVQKIDVRHVDMTTEAMVERIRELALKLGLDPTKLLGANGLAEARRMFENQPAIEGEFKIVDEKRRSADTPG